jgi:hypothetical protein
MAYWHTPTTARTFWRDAPGDDNVLAAYLSAARAAVLAYAPAIPDEPQPDIIDGGGPEDDGGEIIDGGTPESNEDPIPDAWALAQVMQARNIWNAGRAAPSGDFDGSSYGVSAFPIDWQVRQLLRPRRVKGAIA